MVDKRFFNLHGGMDVRDEIDKDNKKILFMAEGKNIDINGKNPRRARGQTSKYTLPTGGWLGLTQHEVDGLFYMRGVDDQGNYYRLTDDDGEFIVSNAVSGLSHASFEKSVSVLASGLIFLSPDGINMYVGKGVTGTATGYIYQYVLSIAWDVSTATYTNKSKTISEQSDEFNSIFFKPDGKNMYVSVCDYTERSHIYQYTLSIAWDISTATYANKEKNVTAQSYDLASIFLSSDGKNMYVGDYSSGTVYQYALSTAWDVSTATYTNKSKNTTAQILDELVGIFLNSDGTEMYVISRNKRIVCQYALSTAWDVSTATYTGIYIDLQDLNGVYPWEIFFKPDCTEMYIPGDTNTVYQYTIIIESGGVKGGIIGGITGIIPCFFQFKNNLIVITGADDPFYDTGSAIGQTGLYTARTVYGTCGASYHGRIWIAHGHAIFWTAANSVDDWTTVNDAGWKDDFIGTIVQLLPYQGNLYIITTSNIYYLSGYDTTDFRVDHYSEIGLFSKHAAINFDGKIYIWDNGLYPLETISELAQQRVKNDFSFRVHELFTEIDKDRLDEIILIPYENRKQLWCYVPITGEAELYKAYIANFINMQDNIISFYTREANDITCACEFKGNIYTGTSDGNIYLEDSGATFDGNAVVSTLRFTIMAFGSSRVKRLKEFMAWFNANYANKCKVSYILDGNIDEKYTENIDLSVSMSNNKDRINEFIPIMPDQFTTIQIEISTSETDEDYELLGFEFLGLTPTKSINQI